MSVALTTYSFYQYGDKPRLSGVYFFQASFKPVLYTATFCAAHMNQKGNTAITIRDVAHHANVAMTTVSRVLNNEPNVRQETRDRVLNSVQTLGYKPNISARNLASTHSYCIGMFYDVLDSNYFNMLLIGSLIQCREEGYQLVIEAFDDKFSYQYTSALDRVKQLKLDGVILPEPICDYEVLVKALVACNIPYVRVSPQTDKHNAPYVCIDDRAAAYNLTKYLLSLGHKELGIVKGRDRDKTSVLRYQGFCDALEESDLHCLPENEVLGDYSYGSGIKCTEKLLGHKKRPTAIFASNDEMAAAVIATANRLGFSVPKDLSVAGFDNAAISMNVFPNITTVNQNLQQLGRIATELLFKKIKNAERGNQTDPLHSILDFETIIRQSTAAPKLFSSSWRR